jgi:chemotaxis-related protein WspD
VTSLPLLTTPVDDCWNRIGVRGDHSCPELKKVVHCHNCHVFAGAGRRFLDAPSPPGYLDEWTRRLAVPAEESSADLLGVLIFRLGEEWLGLRVGAMVEVTGPRRVHRVPHRGGVLAGLVNIRGELHLCVHLDQVLHLQKDEGDDTKDEPEAANAEASFGVHPSSFKRMLVVRREAERWVFPVDEVDQVHRFATSEMTRVPPTVGRALARLARGVFHWQGRSIGLIDDERLFATLRGKVR